MMEAKTYSIWGYADLDGKHIIEITYQPDSHTQKFIRLEKIEHSDQFINLLLEAGYEDVT